MRVSSYRNETNPEIVRLFVSSSMASETNKATYPVRHYMKVYKIKKYSYESTTNHPFLPSISYEQTKKRNNLPHPWRHP